MNLFKKYLYLKKKKEKRINIIRINIQIRNLYKNILPQIIRK